MDQLCAATFSGAHLCHAAEYIASGSVVTPPASGAWVDPSTLDGSTTAIVGSRKLGRHLFSYDCTDWTSNSVNSYGYWLDQNGGITNNGSCASQHVLACCNSPAKTTFSGYTTFTAAGGGFGGSGRYGMHARCAAEFPGSHMCHAAEWIRAQVATPPPNAGAWLDPSSIDGSTTVIAGTPEAGRHLFSYDCTDWTSSSVNSYGYWIDTNGGISNNGSCATVHSIACCQ
jgi:hypothetical protein